MKAPLRDPSKYCAFYKDTGHWTRDCRNLKSEIKHLFLEGYLSDLVDRNRGPYRRNIELNNPTNRSKFVPSNLVLRDNNIPNQPLEMTCI